MRYGLTTRIDDKYNFLVSLKGKFPTKLKISKNKFKQLVRENTFKDIDTELIMLDKNGNPLNPFMNMKVIFDEEVKDFELE